MSIRRTLKRKRRKKKKSWGRKLTVIHIFTDREGRKTVYSYYKGRKKRKKDWLQKRGNGVNGYYAGEEQTLLLEGKVVRKGFVLPTRKKNFRPQREEPATSGGKEEKKKCHINIGGGKRKII